MKTVTERLPANPSPKAFRILTGDRPPIRPATIPAAVTTSIEFSRSANPTTTTAMASRTHMVPPRDGRCDSRHHRRLLNDPAIDHSNKLACQVFQSCRRYDARRLGREVGVDGDQGVRL